MRIQDSEPLSRAARKLNFLYDHIICITNILIDLLHYLKQEFVLIFQMAEDNTDFPL